MVQEEDRSSLLIILILLLHCPKYCIIFEENTNLFPQWEQKLVFVKGRNILDITMVCDPPVGHNTSIHYIFKFKI